MKLNSIIVDKAGMLYQKYLEMNFQKRLLILTGFAFIVRLVFMQQLTMELDTYYYARLAQDIKNSIISGKIFTQPITNDNYYGIDYRSPLYALLSGIVAVAAGNVELSLLIVSILAGTAIVIPVFLMARSFWGEYAGDIAALLICFSPQLIMHATMGRTESLYVLVYTLALYFSILAYEHSKLKYFVLSGVFWGLAYQTRFESLTGLLVTLFLFAFCIFRKKKTVKESSICAKGIIVFTIVAALIILPYILILYGNTGKLSITSPSKTLLDLSESLWITSGREGGYYSFNYYYGDPGEYSWSKLKALVPQDPDAIAEKNLSVILPAIIKQIPLNISYLLTNFNLCILFFLILPALLGWKIKDPRIAIIWMYFLTIIPISILSHWSPDPRYYAYLIPPVSILVSGTFYKLGNWDGVDFNISNSKIRTVVLTFILPASLYLSWYFVPGQTLIHTWFELPFRALVQPLHKSLPIILFIFAGLSLFSLCCAFIWKKIPTMLIIPTICLGLTVVAAGFVEPRLTLPATPSGFFTSEQFYFVRSLIIWFFAIGFVHEIFIQLKQQMVLPERLRKSLLTICLLLVFAFSLQNLTVINTSRSIYRYFNYHEKAVEAVKQAGKITLMCRHPHDAFAAGAAWKKIPPIYDLNTFVKEYNSNLPDFIIVDDLPLFEGNFMSVYPFFQIMKAKGELTVVDYYEKYDTRYSDKKIRVWVYRVNGAKKTGNRLDDKYSGMSLKIHCFSACPASVVKMPLAALHIWQSFRNNSLNNGRTIYRGPDKNAKIIWKYKAGHEIFSSPAITKNGAIIFGCDDSNLYALGKDGKLLWKYAADYYVSSSPSVSGQGYIYFGSDDQRMYSLTQKGKLRWGFQTGYFISSGVKFTSHGDVVFGGEDKYVYCISPQGQLKWKYKTGGEITATPAICMLQSRNGSTQTETILATSHDGFLYALSGSGKLLWKYKAGSEILSSPAVDDKGNIFICSRKGRLFSLASGGKKNWVFKAGGEVDSSPAVMTDGSIVFGCKDHYLYRVSGKGKILWKFEAGYDIESSPAIDSAGNIYFGSHDRYLYGVNRNGKLLWKIETGGAVYSSPAISSDGTLYAGSMDKHLYAIKGR